MQLPALTRTTRVEADHPKNLMGDLQNEIATELGVDPPSPVKLIVLAVPSAAGRVTMNAAFLHKYGLSATVATTQGAVDGLAGFLVEVTILLLALVFGDTDLQIDTGDLNWGLILLVILLLGMAAIIAVTQVQKLRDLVMPVLSEAFGMVRDVLKDPRRAVGLLGSNALSRLVLGLCLWLVLMGIGTPLPLLNALVVTVATNLLAGLVPIPGGIGVAEATMTALLVLAGVPDDAAFAAAVVFRVETFTSPPPDSSRHAGCSTATTCDG